jgi:hypothetical protein
VQEKVVCVLRLPRARMWLLLWGERGKGEQPALRSEFCQGP